MLKNKCYNKLSLLIEVYYSLKKLHNREKQWLLSKSKKAIKQLHKYNRKSKHKTNNDCDKSENKNKNEITLRAPSMFSIRKNTEETVRFFKDVTDKVANVKVNGSLFFDLHNVEVVTVDAIMYLIAIVRNMKRINAFHINCSGNMPKNPKAREIIETSGFYQYLIPVTMKKHIESTDHINITCGNDADPIVIGNICDYIHHHSNYDRYDTKFLFTILVELMTNTKQHAYRNNSIMNNNWYIYVENHDEHIRFVFLDTGSGIPNTIKTDFWEKVKNYISNNDAFFIASALKGKYRSETNEEHRGKGLPEIYDRVKDNKISDFTIVSGCGKCLINDMGAIEETQLEKDFVGTLFSWNLLK